jgi:hypothetical protein
MGRPDARRRGAKPAEGTRWIEVDFMEDLAGELLRIVADSSKVEDLYRVLGEYCHLIRNRLNSLKLSMYLMRRTSPDPGAGHWPELEGRYRELEQFVERLQTICRPLRLATIPAALGLLIQERFPAWARWFEPKRITLELNPPREAAIGTFDPIRLAQGLDAFVSWRSRAASAGSIVQLSWWTTPGELALDWVEVAADPDRAGSPDEEPDSGLALPLLARVLSSHGGRLETDREGSARFRMWWPIDAAIGRGNRGHEAPARPSGPGDPPGRPAIPAGGR